MLDDFSIVTTSGIVLWRRSYAPVSSNLVCRGATEVGCARDGAQPAVQEGQVHAEMDGGEGCGIGICGG
jgi:hypothetical protein